MAPEIAPVYLVDNDLWFTPLESMTVGDGAHRLAGESVPDGWERKHKAVWTHLRPIGAAVVEQGWKVHVSCTPAHYRDVVERVWETCESLQVPWKFNSHARLHRAMNGKGATRGASGKAVTIYPRHEDQLRALLDRLESALAGVEGPYILSDIRWKNTPVYLRYGGFASMWCVDDSGNRVLAVKDPQGRLVPDVRGPVFAPPAWVSMPQWLADGTGYERQRTPEDPTLHGYRVRSSLHFSNAGGVYLAAGPDGTAVVLKEARPHAGIDANGQDAVTRLHHEERVLRALAGRTWAPRVIDAFTEWEHHYLVLEHVEGDTLDALIRHEYPLTRPNPTPRDRAAYQARMQPLLAELERIVRELHGCGYRFGDLTPNNVMVADGGARVVLLDFESTSPLDSRRVPNLVTRGFSPERPMTGEAADWYSFACCQLWAYAPYNRLASLKPEALDEAADSMESWFDLPADDIAQVRSRLRLLAPQADTAPPKPARSDLLATVVEAANPADAVQLYPGDMRGFDDAARLGLAYGASGVLLAFQAAGQRPPEAHLEWLHRAIDSAPAGTPTGLYDGLAGAALVLFRQSDPLYQKVIDRILDTPADEATNLFSGRTGLAHLLLEIGETGQGLAMAESVRDRLDANPGDAPVGVTNGLSGHAILFARCHRLTSDEHWRDAHLATLDRALGTDFQRLGRGLSTGTAGIALALLSGIDWLTEGHYSNLQSLLDDIDVEVLPQGGLFGGHAGAAYALAQANRVFDKRGAPALGQLGRADRYIGAPTPGGTALIGRQAARFSLDLATGSAGVILAERAVADPQMCQLPGMELDMPTNNRRQPL